MNKLSAVRFGLAVAVASALAYVACAVTLAVMPKDTAVRIFNALMHGMDIEPLMRTDVPLPETLLGAASTFVLAWIFGAVIGTTYNIAAPRNR